LALQWRPASADSGNASKEGAARGASDEDEPRPRCLAMTPLLKRARSESELDESGTRKRYVCRKSTGGTGGAGGEGGEGGEGGAASRAASSAAQLNVASSSSVPNAAQDEGSSQSDHLKTATEKMAEKEVHAKRRAFEQEFRVQQRLGSDFKACNAGKLRTADGQSALTGKAARGTTAGKKLFRADLRTLQVMRERGLVTKECYTGHVPGIPVGSRFFCRTEMCMVGLHGHWMSGICRHKVEPQAVSVVMSGIYEDERDNGETVEYIGEGGLSPRTQKQFQDQQPSTGNLALLKSEGLGLPVRVIRGMNDANAPIGKVFTYDGLYMVEGHKYENGKTNFKVYKFQLRRLPGQPTLHSTRVVYTRGSAPTGYRNKHIVDADFSDGQERIPIVVVNEVDSEPSPRLHCKYTTRYVDAIGQPIHVPQPAAGSGCKCTSGCKIASECACAARSKVLDPSNNLMMPYLEGKLTWACSMLYECGPHCLSPANSANRVIQHGIKYRLEVFKTKNRGWGVRSHDTIPPGAFVCTYTGELITNEEADNVDHMYLFNIDGVQTAANKKLKQFSASEPESAHEREKLQEHKPARYCVNAMRFGSVARFINHSCRPNLFVQPVMYHQRDTDMHYLCLFAMETVYPFTELTYDYAYCTTDTERNSDGTVQHVPCLCGAETCRGRFL